MLHRLSSTQKESMSVADDAENGFSEMKDGVPETMPLTSSVNTPTFTRFIPRKLLRLKVLGLEPSPELLAIAMVYFVQGTLGLSKLALSFFFKDDLQVEPAQVAFLMGLAGIPWVVKPLYGFLSDSIPLFGYRRRSYLILCGMLGTLSWLALSTWVESTSGAVAMMLVGAFSTACSDVVVDSIVVERARNEPQTTAGSLQSLCWASAAVGGIASAYFSGSLVDTMGVRWVFGATAVFPLMVSCSSLLIHEQPVGLRPIWNTPDHEHGPTSRSHSLSRQLVKQMSALWLAFSRRDILLPTIFVFLWQATPSAETAMFYFQTNELHFSAEFLGRVRLLASLASLTGVVMYNQFLKKLPLKRLLLWAMILGTALRSTQLLLVSGANRTLGLSDELFVLADSALLTVLAQVSFMPILVLAARLCPEGVEATLFATLMSICNGGSFTGSALGGGLTGVLGVTSTNFDNLFMLVLLCTLGTMLPAPFLGLLPAEVEISESDDEQRSKEHS